MEKARAADTRSCVEELPELATPAQFAKALNVSRKTIYRMCEEGQLKAVRLRSKLRIMRDESLAMLGM